MRALYIIAWVCLVLSIIVHVLSILGPEDIFSDVDSFIWFLHGGCIFLGLPMILCIQKLAFGTQEKDCWKVALQYCPLWMKRMVGFFLFYGIVNFIIFITKSEEPTNSSSTPASIFKGFSGHWMIFYSIEMATFYSYLKKRSSDISKNFSNNQIVPMDKAFRQQYDSKMDRYQTKWNKYSQIILKFFIVGIIFSILVWLAFKGYPWFLGCTLFSLFPFIVIHLIYAIYSGWRANVYLQKNHFKIWKKSKSSSLADRMESQRLIKEVDDPYLKSFTLKATRFSKICFWVWLILIGLVLTGLTLLQ